MHPLLSYVLKSGLSLALFYLIYRLLLRKETFFRVNRIFLLGAMACSLVIPAITLESPFRTKTVDVTGYSIETVYNGTVHRTDITDYLLYVYLAGVVILLAHFVLRLLRLYDLTKKYGITEINGRKFVFTDNGISDFTFFNIIFLDRSKLQESDLQHIISHEDVHIRQFHTFDSLFAELYAIVHWFNPFVWPYKGAIKETHEFLADNAVIAQGCDRARYQTLIFERFVGVRIFSLANNFHQSQIRRRITMMQKKQSSKWSRLRVLLILPVLSLLILAFARPRALFDAGASPLTGPVLSSADYIPQDDDDTKKKEEIKKISTMLKELKIKYKEAETDEERAKIKEKAAVLEKKLQHLKQEGSENPETVKVTNADMEKKFETARMDLKKQYKAAETDEERDEIKKKIQMLDEKYKQWQQEYQKKMSDKKEEK